MSNKFTPKAQNALNAALNFASDLGHSYIGSEHLLLGLLSTPDSAAARILTSRGAKLDSVKSCVIEITGVGSPEPVSPSDMTPRTKKIIEESAYRSVQCGQSYIGTEHLLLSLISDRECVAVRILEGLGVSPSDVSSDLEGYLVSSPSAQNAQKKVKETGTGKQEIGVLRSYGRDLCELAEKGRLDPIIGRERETERVIQILSRRNKNNPCLIGEPGVGKTAVVEGLAERIAERDVPEILQGKRIISLDLASMIAGAKYRGEFEERLKKVLSEVEKNPDIIVFIDEIHTIIGAGAAEGAVDAANIIKPALARGELQVIGATTITEYRAHIEKDAALERRFQSVNVGESSREETLRILEGLRTRYESHHKLTISKEALTAAVELSIRYIPDRFLPDKAIDLVDEAAARLRLKIFTSPPEHKRMLEELSRVECEKSEAITEQNFELAASLRDREKELRKRYEAVKGEWEKRKKDENLTLSESDIADVVTQWTQIPVSRLLEDEGERLRKLEARLGERVVGQESAIAAVASAIRRSRTGLSDPKRPIGSFIFAGPTGVGKTEVCRALSSVLFGSDDSMIRLDMSEYMEKHTVSKLIGSPPGYIGYGEGGILTEKVRRRPYSLVLFDEIEKAHPDVFNLLLQILDDGILTDSEGRRVVFRNCIIIMTTNLGSRLHGETGRVGFTAAGSDYADSESQTRVKSALKTTFRPEFLGRVDEIIVFRSLGDTDLERIASLILGGIADRIESNGIFIEFDGGVIKEAVRLAKAEDLGARGLRRALRQLVETPFSDALLGGDVAKGDFVSVSFDGERTVITKKRLKNSGKDSISAKPSARRS